MGIKILTNDELRQGFINKIVLELHVLGLSLHDPYLRFDESTGKWITGPIDWEEFWRVVWGNGPSKKERMELRVQAHADGVWVRKAPQAYSERMEASQ